MRRRELAEMDLIGLLTSAFQIEWHLRRGRPFRDRKNTSSKKRCFKESWQTWVLSWRLFRQWKSLQGLGGPSREVAEMCLIRRASIKEARDGKWVIQQRSGNDEREKMNECVQGRKEADCKEPHNPECDGQDCGAISQIKSLPTLSLDLHSWLWELWLWCSKYENRTQVWNGKLGPNAAQYTNQDIYVKHCWLELQW